MRKPRQTWPAIVLLSRSAVVRTRASSPAPMRSPASERSICARARRRSRSSTTVDCSKYTSAAGATGVARRARKTGPIMLLGAGQRPGAIITCPSASARETGRVMTSADDDGIRHALLQLLEANPPDEEMLLARFESRRQEGESVYSAILYILTHLSFSEAEA